MPLFESVQHHLLTPAVLFFFLGLIASLVKSDLALPEAVVQGLSIYLLIAIGFAGGVELAAAGLTATVFKTAVVAVAAGFFIPLIAFGVLRRITDAVNAAAIAAHYGSVSAVTFVSASAFLSAGGIAYEPFLVAIMAVMEAPAIIAGILLARFGCRTEQTALSATQSMLRSDRRLLQEVCLNGSVFLLIGSLVIGAITGERGHALVAPVLVEPFQGLLGIFLLSMGLTAGRGLAAFRKIGLPLVVFGLIMPLAGGGLGVLAGTLLGLTPGGTTLLAVLFASASYIAVPAAMKIALPQANPALALTMALGITFPFNLLVGIPLYHQWTMVAYGAIS